MRAAVTLKTVGMAPTHTIPAFSKMFMLSFQTKACVRLQSSQSASLLIYCSAQRKRRLNPSIFVRKFHGRGESDTISLTGTIEQPIQLKQSNDGRTVAETQLSVQNTSVNVIFQDASCETAAKFLKESDKVWIHGLVKFVPENDEKANAFCKVFVKSWSFAKSQSLEKAACSEQSLCSKDIQRTAGSRGESCKTSHSWTRMPSQWKLAVPDPKKPSTVHRDYCKAAIEKLWMSFFSNPSEWRDFRICKTNYFHPDFRHKRTGEALWLGFKSTPEWVLMKFGISDALNEVSSFQEKSAMVEKQWVNFFSDSSKWWDIRQQKKTTSYPDFVHKVTCEPLWIDGKHTPEWVHSKLTLRNAPKLSTNYLDVEEEGRKMEEKKAAIESLWKGFFVDPSEWWDQRNNKMHPNAPDFKHKETGEALWLKDNLNPSWVVSQIEIWDSMKRAVRTEVTGKFEDSIFVNLF